MNALGGIIKGRIENDGPISLYDYMKMALGHPVHGYYSHQDPFGEAGDFITAPEISQMFGELIGLWAVDVWTKLGNPDKFHLVELGPGNGTLMADALKSARLVPEFLAASEIHLIENSARLRAKQAATLESHHVCWHNALPNLEGAPVILLANEFFDALPIHQYFYKSDSWRERLVTTMDDGFAFDLSPKASPLPHAPAAINGDVFEVCPEGELIIKQISTILSKERGAALIIDYGSTETLLGDSFQALKGHEYADPLHTPGEVDLTAHVKFNTLAEIAQAHNILVQGPTAQGRFLERLGIEARHHLLRQKAGNAQKEKLDAQLRRLTSAKEMGTLFKVMALSHQVSRPTEGFGD